MRLPSVHFLLEPRIKAAHPTGSRYICNPPVTTTDEDWIILTDDAQTFVYTAQQVGWYSSDEGYQYPRSEDDGEAPDPQFKSIRCKDLNFIVISDAEYYDKYVGATELAKKYNLLSKVDRIQLFHLVLDGELLSEEFITEQQSRRASLPTQDDLPRAMTRPYISAETLAAARRALTTSTLDGAQAVPYDSQEYLYRGTTNAATAGVPDAVGAVGGLQEPSF